MKTQYNEVPKEYRRNYGKEVVEGLQMFTVCLGIAMLILVMFVMA